MKFKFNPSSSGAVGIILVSQHNVVGAKEKSKCHHVLKYYKALSESVTVIDDNSISTQEFSTGPLFHFRRQERVFLDPTTCYIPQAHSSLKEMIQERVLLHQTRERCVYDEKKCV